MASDPHENVPASSLRAQNFKLTPLPLTGLTLFCPSLVRAAGLHFELSLLLMNWHTSTGRPSFMSLISIYSQNPDEILILFIIIMKVKL